MAVRVCQMWASREYLNNNGGVVPISQMTPRQLEAEVQRLGEVQKRLIAEASTVRRHRDIFQGRWIELSQVRSLLAACGCACTCFSWVLLRWSLAPLQMFRILLAIPSMASSVRTSRKSL